MIVILEGINKSGKSALITLIEAKLHEIQPKYTFNGVTVLRDPGGTPIGEEIRKLVKFYPGQVDPVTQTLLFTAARHELALKVRAEVAKGNIVLLDRWWFSTYAYQGALGVDKSTIGHLNNAFSDLSPANGPVPLAFLIDISSATAAARAGKPQVEEVQKTDRFEAKGLAYTETVRALYLELVERGFLQRIDGEVGTEADVMDDLWPHVMVGVLQEFKRR